MNSNEIKNKVLITGATGGLGLVLVKTFVENGFEVLGAGRRVSMRDKIMSYGAKFIHADLTNLADLKNLCDGQDIIIHAAALSDSWGKPQDFYKINVTATKNLLKAAKDKNVQKFIFISSPSIYAAMKDQYAIKEDDKPSCPPLNEYAKTKLKAEKIVLDANSEIFKTGILRPRAIVGPDDRVLLPKIMEMINCGILPLFRNGEATIELTDVRDVANAVLLTIQNIEEISGQAFNISGGKPIRIKELASKLAQCSNQKIHFVPMPMIIANYLAQKLEKRGVRNNYETEPKLTLYSLATLAYSQTFDMTKANKKLGYKPSYDAVQTILDVAKERAA